MDIFHNINSCIAVASGIISLLTFLYVTIGGQVIMKEVKLTSISSTPVRFKVRLKNYNVQQITNIVSACFYNGGQVPSSVRTEIIRLTAPDGIKNALSNHLPVGADMLINLSNHPSTLWGEEQLSAATEYDEIVDLSFPDVNPMAEENEISMLADDCVKKILDCSKGRTPVVHVMGEMNLTYAIVNRLRGRGIECVASTTKRIATELPDGTKQSLFQFVKFRQYE